MPSLLNHMILLFQLTFLVGKESAAAPLALIRPQAVKKECRRARLPASTGTRRFTVVTVRCLPGAPQASTRTFSCVLMNNHGVQCGAGPLNHSGSAARLWDKTESGVYH